MTYPDDAQPSMQPQRIIHSAYQHVISRQWQQERSLRKSMLMYPLFICSSPDEVEDITQMPGQKRYGTNRVVEYVASLVKKGLRSVILFGVTKNVDEKDLTASKADNADAPVITAIKLLKESFPQLFICCDVCLCGYTSHGHCGILKNDGRIDLDESVKRLAEIALAYAKAGADGVAPSDMMDGRVAAIKEILGRNKLANSVMLLSYSAKYSSGLYGPFRDAACSAPAFGDRQCYQLPSGSRKLALRAIQRDREEGADVIIVKPAATYMDIIREATNAAPELTIAAYHVSGEYSMIYHGAKAGIFDLRQMAFEVTEGLLRAGATMIISYFTPQFLDWLDD